MLSLRPQLYSKIIFKLFKKLNIINSLLVKITNNMNNEQQPMYCMSYDTMIKKESDKMYKEEQRLRQAGHKCTIILESIPPQLSWCGNEKCVNK